MYCEDVEEIFLSLGISLSGMDTKTGDWRNSDKDFQYIYHRFKMLKTKVDQLATSATGMAGIVGNRHALKEAELSLREAKRSVKEAKSVKTLSFIGMVFIPLAYTSGLFSMSDQFRPGIRTVLGLFCRISSANSSCFCRCILGPTGLRR